MRVLFIFGTRPEAIKMAPLIKELQRDSFFQVLLCVTGQHRHLLDQVLDFYRIQPDYDCNIMQKSQDLFDITEASLKQLKIVLADSRPEIVIVQGDTTTAFAGALSAYYSKVKIAHLEAGLRSDNKYVPFPEEINRGLIDRMADYYFAHTESAVANLFNEGIKENVWNTGNTVIDALHAGLQIIKDKNISFESEFSGVNFSRKIILITCHRRENIGEPFSGICGALKDVAEKFTDTELIYPVHPNPSIRDRAYELLGSVPGVHLIEPLDYPHMIWFMSKSSFILTDSGGIQEEAPALGKPVLVLREVTERPEGLRAGCAKLAGTSRDPIFKEVSELLSNKIAYESMARARNPYGDGHASVYIAEILRRILPCGVGPM